MKGFFIPLYRWFLCAGMLLLNSLLMAQEPQSAYTDGEWCKFRVHYGFVTAGYASIKVQASTLDAKTCLSHPRRGPYFGNLQMVFLR